MANQEETQRPSHFIKAILSLENARMKIPARFVKEHGKTLSKDAYLEAGPSGSTWKLGVERCEEGRVWLREGWKAFAEYYSIKFAHILMFRYKGKSKFHVSIFDPSLMEIKYPVEASSKSGGGFDQSKAVETEEDETDDEDEGEEGEEDTDDDVDYDDDADYDDDDEEEECRQRLQKYNEKSHAKHSSEKRTERIIDAWDRVYARALAFESSNPFFIVRMHTNYVDSKKCILYLPLEHSKKHIYGKENKGITLVGEDGKPYFVKYSIGKNLQVRLWTSGWSVFVNTNLLQTGDICVFELIDSVDMVYKVNIFRITDYEEKEEQEEDGYDDDDGDEEDQEEGDRANQSCKKRTRCALSAGDKVLKRAEAYKSSHPSFSVKMLPKSLLCVPHTHSIRHFRDKKNKVAYLKVGENGRTWFVKYCIGPHQQVRFLKFRWTIFVKDNLLEDGDVCIFELIDSTKMVYKVTIFRIADYEDDEDDDSDNEDADDECSPVTQSKKRIQYPISARNRVLERAQSHSFKCQNPCFHLVMTEYHLSTRHSRLYIPTPHAKEYLLVRGEGKICLTNGRDQRTWSAPYAIEAPPLLRVRLKTAGWRQFTDDNHLQVGDVCVFELVDSSRMEYTVTIFRVADYA